MLATAIKRSRRNTSVQFSRHRPRSMTAPASTKCATASNIKALAPHWPLSFTLQLPKPQPDTLGSSGFSSNRALPPRWWSHHLYRGPEGKEIEIMYSKTKAESEVIAQQFLDEPVIGFDMEWPWGSWMEDTLQNKIGLIQIASEDKIGLFHIGLHLGKTTADVIAPALIKIIEDPDIGKAGVNILRADFSRLSRFFGLQPRGAIELSNLYRLAKFGTHAPEYVSVKLVSMAQQVEDQFGLPLHKGDVRTSDWSKPLSKAQIDYAAGDAYAGFMLYKYMNAKRLAMTPTPPPPIYAERYPSGKASRDDPIILDVGDGTTITTAEFFRVYPKKTGKTATSKATASGTDTNPLDEISQALYNELLMRRALLAEKANIPPTRVVSDILLRAIARARPHDTPSLLAIKGVGKIQQQRYGDEWLQAIALFLKTKGIEQPVSTTEPSASKEEKSQAPRTPRRRHANRQDSSDSLSSLAFDEPAPKVPQLQTGLSFTLAESKLDADGTTTNGGKLESDSDSSLASLDFGTPPSAQLSSSKKRKRVRSPRKQRRPDPDSHEPPETSPHNQSLNFLESIHKRVATTPNTRSKGHLFNEPLLSHALSLARPPTTPSKPAPGPQKSPSHHPVPPLPPQAQSSTSAAELSLASRIAKSKLLAFSKLVTRKLPGPRPPTAPPIVTPYTLDLIVRARPQTQEELERIPGVDSLLLACEKTGMNLLRNVIKFIGKG